MNLTEFLRDDQILTTINSVSVISFQLSSAASKSDEYPLLFCRQLMAYCGRKGGQEVIAGSMDAENNNALMASLQSTFLGNEAWYWLGADEYLSKKAAETWYNYLALYQGPNKLFFFTKHTMRATKTCAVVSIPAEVGYPLFLEIARMMGVQLPSFADHIYRFHKVIPVETAVLLIQYGSVVGKNGERFVQEWLHQLIVPEVSLFALSQAFFARQSRTFLRQWKQIESQYGTSFWISFWAEQLWQAYAYIRLHKAGKVMEAKQVGYRLPFSFKNRDWRSHAPDALQLAHHRLYELDFHVKNGGSETALDLLLIGMVQR